MVTHTIRLVATGALVALCLAGVSLRAQETRVIPTPQVIDVQRLGPQVGERVPDFDLVDQTGRRRTLASVMGPSGAVLVFYRSSNW